MTVSADYLESEDEGADPVDRDRHLLLAVDDTEKSRRALRYVSAVVGGDRGFRITLLHIVPEPSGDYFRNESERTRWTEEKKNASERLLAGCRDQLVASGVDGDRVIPRVVVKSCTSLADCILDEQVQQDCGTLVIVRRGISKKEEFMFGSTSSRILHEARNCAVWVIE